MAVEYFGDNGHDLEDINNPCALCARRSFYLEATRPVDRAPAPGQQLVDSWRAEHGDEEFPQ